MFRKEASLPCRIAFEAIIGKNLQRAVKESKYKYRDCKTIFITKHFPHVLEF